MPVTKATVVASCAVDNNVPIIPGLTGTFEEIQSKVAAQKAPITHSFVRIPHSFNHPGDDII
jgi:hypothetical protein